MIRSMTAFARQERQGAWGSLTLELRSVNHRYLEVMPRMSEELRVWESLVRERLHQRLARGKVECNLRYQAPAQAEGELEVNDALAKALAHATRHVDSLIYNPAPISAIDILRWPGVLQARQVDEEVLKSELLALLEAGIDELVATREREGDKLKAHILDRCTAIEAVAATVQARLPEVLQAQRDRLVARLAELKGELDQGRLEQELVMMAQKMDVDEELSRLQAHTGEVRHVLGQDQPVGRRLDFLMQELNREANTLGSKSVHTDTTRASVDLKVYIEQMREQIQNIE